MLFAIWRVCAFKRWAAAAVFALLSGLVGMPMPGAVGWAAAASLEGQHFEDTTRLADRTLRLNGLGLRGVAWIRAFVAALYLSAPTRDAAQALAMPGPKRLSLRIMLAAPRSELGKSLSSRVARHESEAVQQQLAERLRRLIAHIDGLGQLQEGDTIDLDYTPEAGTVLRHNDQAVGTALAGEDLYRAVLKVFIGEHPVDKRLKEGLLRGGA